MPPVGFEPTISAGERPQTNALDRAATGTGIMMIMMVIIQELWRNVLGLLRALVRVTK